MRATPLGIDGLVLFDPVVHADSRGYFFESFNDEIFRAATGSAETFVQDNHSVSRRGVLRGLHLQLPPYAQGKLVRVIAGRAFDVAVDLRDISPTRLQWAGVELSAANRLQLWIPPGFAHGFLALEDGTELLYKTTANWNPDSERTLRWDDPSIGIDWPLDGVEPLLSDKDANAKRLIP